MRVLLNRTLPAALCTVSVLLTVGQVPCATASELGDIVARVDYGFYTADARMVEAALSELARADSDDGAHAYYEAYAAFRLSRIDRTARPRERRALITTCLDAGHTSALAEDWAAEAWILIAACSLQGVAQEPSRALGHKARLARALAAARKIDADNPRLLLVESWTREEESSKVVEQDRERKLLERAREAFDARGYEDGPDWGRAELLASLGEIYLELGERREARDLIEQALIEAPEYYFALGLRKRLSLAR